MATNWFDLLVEVFAAASDDATKWSFATGYPIGPDRLITAAHVLKEDSTCIKVRLKESGLQGKLLPVNRVVWDGRPRGFDAAILECQLPAHLLAEIPKPLEVMPNTSVTADGMGYPLKTGFGDDRPPAFINGTIGGMPSNFKEYELSCSDRRGNERYQWEPGDWKGVSGSPIFVGGKLAGVIKTHEDTHQFDHFRVTAICRLLEDRDFCEAIHWRDKMEENQLSEIRDEIEEKLKKLPGEKIRRRRTEMPILKYLYDVLGCDIRRELDELEKPLAEFLTETRETTLESLVQAHAFLCEQRQKKSAVLVGQIIDLVTPLQIPSHLWAKVRNQVTQSQALIEGVAAGLITTETIAARVDSRDLDLLVPVSVKVISDKKIQCEHRIGPELHGYFPLDQPGRTMEVFVKDLFLSTLGPGVDPMSVDDMMKRLKGDFRVWKNVMNRSRYVVVQMPADPHDRDNWMKVLVTVKKGIEHVTFIELCSSGVDQTLEGSLFRCLNIRFASEGKWLMP